MDINVLELLERSAAGNPRGIAFKDQNRSITYEEVVKEARTIASYIVTHNESHNKPIAVCIDRNIESIILFLGIVYSGNFYVPLDTTMPQERIETILRDLQPLFIFSSAEQLIEGHVVTDYVQLVEGSIQEKELQLVRQLAIDTDPLYGIYTSGSTGAPKCVLISHRSVLDLVEQFALTFPFPKEAVFGNQAPFDFDVSVKDIYNSLYLGATMVVIPKQFFSMPLKLIAFLNEEKVNVIIWAVSALRIVENFKTFTKDSPKYLRLIMFSGEIMPVKVLNYWKQALPDTTFVNLYGPTEITCNCTYYQINRNFAPEEAIPIGKAFRNTQILLLNLENMQLITKPGEQGEICVRGTCLGLGYYNDLEKTADAYVQNSLVSAYPDKIYRTGDIGYYNEEGELYFCSRKDHQIKHMGHRIELGEIERAAAVSSYVDAAVCVFDEEHEKIVFFYQASKIAKEEFTDKKELDRAIVKDLGKKLPKFMWPNRYIQMDELPLNKHGKIDRMGLKKSLHAEQS